jgi:hypothetical protein
MWGNETQRDRVTCSRIFTLIFLTPPFVALSTLFLHSGSSECLPVSHRALSLCPLFFHSTFPIVLPVIMGASPCCSIFTSAHTYTQKPRAHVVQTFNPAIPCEPSLRHNIWEHPGKCGVRHSVVTKTLGSTNTCDLTPYLPILHLYGFRQIVSENISFLTD